MKINIGDYVRTDNGCICKVLEYTDISDNDFYVNTDSPYNVIYKSWIVKSSPNIIDLIEVGDYVNGVLVESIYQKEKDKLYIHSFDTEIMMCFTNNNIETIVTKEMYSSVEYKVNKQ